MTQPKPENKKDENNVSCNNNSNSSHNNSNRHPQPQLNRKENRSCLFLTYPEACQINFKGYVGRRDAKLQNVLCAKNKWRPPKNEQNGVYCFECPFIKKKYIGKTKRKVITRGREHKRAVELQNWGHSGITAHKEHCDAPIDWDNPRILASFQNKNKRALDYDLKYVRLLRFCTMTAAKEKGLMRTMETS